MVLWIILVFQVGICTAYKSTNNKKGSVPEPCSATAIQSIRGQIKHFTVSHSKSASVDDKSIIHFFCPVFGNETNGYCGSDLLNFHVKCSYIVTF